MDLFSMFGVAVETPEEKETKKAKKKPSKTTKKGASKSSKKDAPKDIMYSLPITVYTGYREPFVIEVNEDKYKDGITAKQLKAEIEAICPEYQAKATSVEVNNRTAKAWTVSNSALAVRKGSVKLNKDSHMSLAGHALDFSSVMTDEECEVSLDQLQKTLGEIHPAFKYASFVIEGNYITPVFDNGKMPSTLKFPIRLCLYGRENWQITQEEYNAYLTEKGKEYTGNAVYDEAIIREMIIARYPDFEEGHLMLRYMEDENIVLVTMYVKPSTPSASTKESAKKEETFPTEDVTLSFIFNKIPLSPELFDGKKKVTKKELVDYCATIYPEYDNKNTQIRYDKERKLLIPILQGSSKG